MPSVLKNSRVIDSEDLCLVLQPLIAKKFGRSSAVFLQQLHYWITSERSNGFTHHGKKWVYNTFESWADNLKTYSVSTIKRCIKKLEEAGIIQCKKLNPFKGNRTNYYTIDYKRLSETLSSKEDSSHGVLMPDHTPESLGYQETGQSQSILNHLSKTLDQKDVDNPTLEETHHQVKMTKWSDQNEPIYTEITNKNNNFNKSDELTKNDGGGKGITETPKGFPRETKPCGIAQQVQQVQNNDIKNFKNTDSQNQKSLLKNTTAQDMLDYWNGEFKKSESKMSKYLAPMLVSAFKNKFNSDLNKWKHYCNRISSSKYLTGQDFKLDISWALKFSTIDKILNPNGWLGVKDVPIPGEAVRQKNDLIEKIQNLNESEKCKEIRLKILDRYGAPTYKSWFEPVGLSMDGDRVRFDFPSKFHQSYMETNFDVFR